MTSVHNRLVPLRWHVLFFTTTKDSAKYYNLKRDPSISLLVDDLEGRWYMVVYGQAEMIEQNHVELTRTLLEKYVPADQLDEYLGDNPNRMIVTVHPEKILIGRNSMVLCALLA